MKGADTKFSLIWILFMYIVATVDKFLASISFPLECKPK